MKPIAIDWKEVIGPDEDNRFTEYANLFQAIQKENSAKFGNGRTLHRKQILGCKAVLEIPSDLPDYARQGIFSESGKKETWIRLSSGSMKLQSDSIGDIRGFALKVGGVKGPSALQNGNTSYQDFLLINLEAFSSPKSDEFVGLVSAASKGGASLLGYLIRTYGFLGAFARLKKASASFNKPFSGFATEAFHSAAPIAFGPYAGRVRLLPPKEQIQNKKASQNWGQDISDRLKKESLTYLLQFQFFTDEKTTPIEDASVNWPEKEAPYITLAKLILPMQDTDSEEGKILQKKIEEAAFDPWEALWEHRPLGDVMRARKYVYLASQKGRNAHSGM
ncbi:catalase [Leptospira wolffii]|uniref:Catalase n=1 Tax=Leptospira wolffii TaxID=409998 RepID=A0A2M9Z784_9LEPT|nr:catalase [Leptospira wolffii]PJZ64286.1 catalase [Leptospira wolffii]